jgi:hypothetical protein
MVGQVIHPDLVNACHPALHLMQVSRRLEREAADLEVTLTRRGA